MCQKLGVKKISLTRTAENLFFSACFLLVSIREAEPKDFKKKDALEWCQAEVEKNPKDKASWYTLGTVLAKLGKYEDAVKAFDRVTWLDPLHMRAWDAKAKAFFRMERYQEALDSFERALELDRRDERLWFHIGETLLRLNEPLRALSSFDKAIEIDPNFTEAWYGRGQALREAEDWQALSQKEQIETPEERVHGRKDHHNEKTPLSSPKKNSPPDVLEEDIDLLVGSLDYEDEQDYLLAANMQRYAGNTEEALELYDEAIRKNPECLDAWYLKGTLLYVLDRHKDAVKCFDKVLSLNPDHVWAKKRKAEAEAILLKTQKRSPSAQVRGGKVRKSNEEPRVAHAFTKSWSKMSEIESLLKKAHRCRIAGEYDVAMAYYDNVLEIDWQSGKAWKGKGEVLAEMGRHEEATECFERAAKLNPEDVGVWHSEGKTLHSEGKRPEALAALRKATKLKPELGDAWYESGIILRALGKSVEAHRDLQEAFNLFFLRTLVSNPDREDADQRKLLANKTVKPKPKGALPGGKTRKIALDREDRNLLMFVWDKARTVPQIATQLGVPIAECYRRVNKLLSLGVLKHFVLEDVLSPESKSVGLYKLISRRATIFEADGKIMLEIVMPLEEEISSSGSGDNNLR